MNPILIGPIIGVVKELIDLIPNKNDRDRVAAKLNEMALQSEIDARQGQIDINKEEAKHRSIFVAGWRPFIGWTGGFALAWMYVLKPIMTYALATAGVDIPDLPEIQAENMFELIAILLGVGGLRTFEKFKGVNHR